MVLKPAMDPGHLFLKSLPKEELDRFIVLCRFRGQRSAVPTHACMTLKDIAQLVKRSIAYCGRVCQAFKKACAERREYKPMASRSKRKAAFEKGRKSW